MIQPAVQVEQIGKEYTLGLREKSNQTFREAVVDLAKAPLRRLRHLSGETREGQFWALRDVSFDVPEGEVLGIIGHNGAGKSTLLKILSRITEPTEGRAVVRGRVASLLEVGTGFHQELSGRENVYLNGAILGMSRREIDRKFDEIVDFAGIDKFLDTPIKRYSSGMKVRLAFAVAAHLEPEILIIDEVLAVGDQEFQNKCLGKMQDVATSGRTVLFVSHNMAAVENLCDKLVLLERGQIRRIGDTQEILNVYLNTFAGTETGENRFADEQREGNGAARITSFEAIRHSGSPTGAIKIGDGVRFQFQIRVVENVRQPSLVVAVWNDHAQRLFSLKSHEMHMGDTFWAAGQPVTVSCSVPSLNIRPGRYLIHVGIVDLATRTLIDRVERAAELQIEPADVFGTGKTPGEGLVFFRGDWEFQAAPLTLGVAE